MVKEPGSSFDFGTFIAYLVPGNIILLIWFCLCDALNILSTRQHLLASVTWGIPEVTLLVGVVTFGAYLFGLLLDLVAHPITLPNEMNIKKAAYTKAVADFNKLAKHARIRELLTSFEDNKKQQDNSQRDLFIDALYYRLASSNIWSRQNWHWAFYEFARQMNLLLIPAVVVLSFYVTLLVTINLDLGVSVLIASGAAIVLALVAQAKPRKLLISARDTDCRVYYRHRAWVVFAYLMETDLLVYLREGKEIEPEDTSVEENAA